MAEVSTPNSKIERVFVFGEDQQFHCRIGKDAFFGQHRVQAIDLRLDVPLFEHPAPVHQPVELDDFFPQDRWIAGENLFF